MNQLHNRVIEISKKYNLSHVGSCLTAINIIDEIYSIKQEDEPFILSCGHAGVALYTVLEKYYGFDAEKLYKRHGTHPNRSVEDKIWCSTGSLGHGLPIALGMAFADRTKQVYVLISDGESKEGTLWETANIMHEYSITNLKIHVNYNGWGAYSKIELDYIIRVQEIFPIGNMIIHHTKVEDYGLKGQSAHYVKL